MLYYLYILEGPLKNTKLALTSNSYTFFLYNKKEKQEKEKKEDNNNISLYIPCDDENLVRTINVILDNNEENNKFIIKNSSIETKTDIENRIKFEEPIYINDIPIFFISRKNDLSLSSLVFKRKKKSVKNKILLYITLIILLIIVFFITFFLFVKKTKSIQTTPIEMVSTSEYYGYKGLDNHYCIYNTQNLKSSENEKNQFFYIDIKKISDLFNNQNKKINNLIFKDKEKPKLIFIYHNNSEKEKIVETVRHYFSPYCQANIVPIPIANIIEDVNKLPFTKEIGYQIQEEKRGIVFIFDEKLNTQNKIQFDSFIKKQTSIFGRKFIFFHENIANPSLSNKAVLQENNGYIFIDSQHRYFPKG